MFNDVLFATDVSSHRGAVYFTVGQERILIVVAYLFHASSEEQQAGGSELGALRNCKLGKCSVSSMSSKEQSQKSKSPGKQG